MMFPPVEKLRVLYDADTIRARVRELAGQIDALYGNEPLVVVCVLKGAFLFFSDLVRELSISPELDFVRLASYGNGTESSCSVAFTKDIELSIEGKHVLIVEDIIDSGRSMHVAVLIDKRERREFPVRADFVGFALTSGFIVGYGLDYAEHYRALPAIYCIPDGNS